MPPARQRSDQQEPCEDFSGVIAPTGSIDFGENGVMEWARSQTTCRLVAIGYRQGAEDQEPIASSLAPIAQGGSKIMDMFGKVGLVEIPILIAPDQKNWLDKMIKEGRIAVPPGGTLEKGSLYSMFIRMLLHNAMEEQKRQEALEADDEDE
jgi:hypothetical protein